MTQPEKAPRKRSAKKPPQEFSPNVPLKNLRHEFFAQKLIENKGNATQAYLSTYGGDYVNAEGNAHRLIGNEGIRARVIAIMGQKGLALPDITDKLKQFVNSENEGIGLDATKFAFKLHGAIDPDVQAGSGVLHIEFIQAQKNDLSTDSPHTININANSDLAK